MPRAGVGISFIISGTVIKSALLGPKRRVSENQTRQQPFLRQSGPHTGSLEQHQTPVIPIRARHNTHKAPQKAQHASREYGIYRDRRKGKIIARAEVRVALHACMPVSRGRSNSFCREMMGGARAPSPSGGVAQRGGGLGDGSRGGTRYVLRDTY